MKKLLCLSIVALLSLSAATSYGQDANDSKAKKAVKKTAHETKHGVKVASHEVREKTSKGASRLADPVYKSKQGPAGQTIYIDNQARYYWKDEKGEKHFIELSELKDK